MSTGLQTQDVGNAGQPAGRLEELGTRHGRGALDVKVVMAGQQPEWVAISVIFLRRQRSSVQPPHQGTRGTQGRAHEEAKVRALPSGAEV